MMKHYNAKRTVFIFVNGTHDVISTVQWALYTAVKMLDKPQDIKKIKYTQRILRDSVNVY